MTLLLIEIPDFWHRFELAKIHEIHAIKNISFVSHTLPAERHRAPTQQQSVLPVVLPVENNGNNQNNICILYCIFVVIYYIFFQWRYSP
jgi:hypothetical protein